MCVAFGSRLQIIASAKASVVRCLWYPAPLSGTSSLLSVGRCFVSWLLFWVGTDKTPRLRRTSYTSTAGARGCAAPLTLNFLHNRTEKHHKLDGNGQRYAYYEAEEGRKEGRQPAA